MKQSLSSTTISPLISVIVRTVDRLQMLHECLQSIARQDHPNIEVVLVNDGGPSVQHSLKSEYPFSLQLIEFEYQRGRSEAANRALEASKGEYIAFLDDDDIFYPYHLSTLLEFQLQTQAPIVYSDALCAKQYPAPFQPGRYLTNSLELKQSVDFDPALIRKENYIPLLTTLVHHSCVDAGLRFDQMLEVLEDWDFWIQAASKYTFAHLREITGEYRQRIDGTNTTGQNPTLWEWSRFYLREKHQLEGIIIRDKKREEERYVEVYANCS